VSPLLVWEGSGEVPNFCPEGCGGITEDPYGGPCKTCWDKVGAGKNIDEHSDDDPRCDGQWHPCTACGGTGLYEHQVIF